MRKILFLFISLFAFFVPLEYIYVVLLGFDSPLKPYRIFASLSIIFFLIYILLNNKKLKFDKYDKLFTLLFMYGFVITLVKYYFFYDGNISYAYNDIMLIAFGFLMFLTIKNIDLTISEIQKIMQLFFIAVLMNVFYILYNAFVLSSFLRMNGFFKNPNQAAEAIVIAILFVLFSLSKKRKKSYILLIFPMVAALIFTGSRAAIVGLIVPIFIWYFIDNKKFLIRIVLTSIFGLLLLIGVETLTNNLNVDRLTQRFSSENIIDTGGSGRIDIWKSGFNLAYDTMYLGVGTSQYRAYHHEYIRQIGNAYNTVLEHDLGLHSDYVAMLVEYGILGFILYLYIIISLLRMIYKAGYKREMLSIMFFLILVSMFIQGFFQESYRLPMYWLILGLAMAYIKAMKKHQVVLDTTNNDKIHKESN